MLAHSVLLTILTLPALINGRRVPLANGVIGGVSPPNKINAASAKTPDQAAVMDGNSTRTPRKLRVVENSGVCGTSICLGVSAIAYKILQKLHQVSIRPLDMVI
jgi:hypothetical protein